jgi:hypothetical protein
MGQPSRLLLSGLVALALTVAAVPAQADVADSWAVSIADVMNLVYCLVGAGSCDGLAPASTVDITTDNQAVCEAGGGLWSDGGCVPAAQCFWMGYCGQGGAAAYGISGPYLSYTQSDADAVNFNCELDFYNGKMNFSAYVDSLKAMLGEDGYLGALPAWTTQCCGAWGYNEEGCCGDLTFHDETGCCGDATKDCAGVCGGGAQLDVCNVCGGPGLNAEGCCGTQSEDCTGVCGGGAVIDCNDVCGGGAEVDIFGDCCADGSTCQLTCFSNDLFFYVLNGICVESPECCNAAEGDIIPPPVVSMSTCYGDAGAPIMCQ